MQVREFMTSDVKCIAPETSLKEASAEMREVNVGCLPVCNDDRLVGMVTDRDIVVRAAAYGMDMEDTTVREIMSSDPAYCYEDQGISEAAGIMEKQKIRRLPVLNRKKRLVGMLSLGDFSRREEGHELSAEVLEAVAFRRPQSV